MSDEVWQNCGLTYKISHDTKWLLIFQHNASRGAFTRETAEFNLEKGKFSYLSRISDTRYVKRFNDSYEFLLEYPAQFQDEYNRWIQSKDPLSEWDNNITGTIANGFSPVHLDWPANFGGLMRNNYNTSLLNGQTGNWKWNYAIGDWSDEFIQNNETPGPTFQDGDKYSVKRVTVVFLWIRIKSIVCNVCTRMRKPPLLYKNLFITIFPLLS